MSDAGLLNAEKKNNINMTQGKAGALLKAYGDPQTKIC